MRRHMKTILLLLVVGVAVGAAWWLLSGRSKTDPTPTRIAWTEDGMGYVKYQVDGPAETEPIPLDLPVPEDTFRAFLIRMEEHTDRMAAREQLPNARSEVFLFRVPESWHRDAEDPVLRYLARVEESVSADGFDLTALAGQEVAGCVTICADTAPVLVAIGLCGPEGEIAAWWTDDYAPQEQGDGHWSDLNLETRRLN